MAMRPELLKGHLDALLLAVLEPGPRHGYAVIESLRAGSAGDAGSAHWHGVSGAAPFGAGGSDRQRLGDRRRPAPPKLPTDHGRSFGAR